MKFKNQNLKGVDRDTFDFNVEFAKGLTPEELKLRGLKE